MDKYIIIVIATLLLTSCNYQSVKTGNNEKDSLCIADTTVMLDAKQDFSIEFKTYEKHVLMKADYKRKNIYHENSIILQWPVKAQGLNLDSLQHTLSAFIPDATVEDPQQFVDEWSKQMWAEHGWDWDYNIVESRDEEIENAEVNTVEEENNDNEEEDMIGVQYDTDASLELSCISTDSINHFLTFMRYYSYNNGCGMGSCIYFGFDHLLYDYVNCKRVEIADLIANEKEAVNQLREQCINSEHYAGLEGLENLAELHTNFHIVGTVIFLQFEKYEISFGADGCPELGFDVSKCPEILTEYGKKVFNIK